MDFGKKMWKSSNPYAIHASAECSLPKICKGNFLKYLDFEVRLKTSLKKVDRMVI